MKPLERRKQLHISICMLSLKLHLSSLSFILNTGLTLNLELSSKIIFSQKQEEPFSLTEVGCFSSGEHKGLKVQDKWQKCEDCQPCATSPRHAVRLGLAGNLMDCFILQRRVGGERWWEECWSLHNKPVERYFRQIWGRIRTDWWLKKNRWKVRNKAQNMRSLPLAFKWFSGVQPRLNHLFFKDSCVCLKALKKNMMWNDWSFFQGKFWNSKQLLG